MTRDRARKQRIRARMAETGESYNTAARYLDSQSNNEPCMEHPGELPVEAREDDRR